MEYKGDVVILIPSLNPDNRLIKLVDELLERKEHKNETMYEVNVEK